MEVRTDEVRLHEFRPLRFAPLRLISLRSASLRSGWIDGSFVLQAFQSAPCLRSARCSGSRPRHVRRDKFGQVIGRLDDAALIALTRMLSTVLGLADY
jgi:hypothetical protein